MPKVRSISGPVPLVFVEPWPTSQSSLSAFVWFHPVHLCVDNIFKEIHYKFYQLFYLSYWNRLSDFAQRLQFKNVFTYHPSSNVQLKPFSKGLADNETTFLYEVVVVGTAVEVEGVNVGSPTWTTEKLKGFYWEICLANDCSTKKQSFPVKLQIAWKK